MYNSKRVLVCTSPIPIDALSKAWVCGRSQAGITSSNPTGGMDTCERCVFSGRGLGVGLLTRPQESKREWCVQIA